MCGIIGCTLKSGNAVPLILEGLRRLEYRGYDSAGLAVLSDGDITVIKDRGAVDKIVSKADGLVSPIGIGHTRWATHGEPSEKNAHPHIDCKANLALVHNGIIENYDKLRAKLEGRHAFLSSTDTEVIAHLIEEELSREKVFLKALVNAISYLKGSYAVAVIYKHEPETIFCAKHESPLIVGFSETSAFCASDPLALRGFVEEVYSLRDDELAVLNPGRVKIYDIRGGTLKKVVPEKVSLGDYHLDSVNIRIADGTATIEEIREIPYVLPRSVVPKLRILDEAVKCLLRSRRVPITACGTSYHAGIVGKYYLARLVSLSPEVIIASEFPYWIGVDKGDLVIAISQSGETADVISAIKLAKKKGAKILSIVNVPGSTIDRLADYTLYINAGPEVGVAATKSYVNQISVELQLAIRAAISLGYEDASIHSEIKENIFEAASAISHIIAKYTPIIVKLATRIAKKRSTYFLGRGLHLATAMEGALKLKELSYIHAEGYPAGESKHGPIALIEEGFPVLFTSSRWEAGNEITGNMEEMKARDAWIIAVSDDENILRKADIGMSMPKVSFLTSPMVYIVPWQLLAYFTSKARGYNPDRPRNLAKSVTVK